MKYFTPDLYVRGQSTEDRVVSEVEQLWDEAGERYSEHFQAIATKLAPGLRQMQENYYLHDAVVLSMGRQGNRFVIMLRLDTPPRDLVLFSFDLTAEPEINKEALPPEHRGHGQVEWMYDEVELVAGPPPTCVQSILFSNGWEVRLSFRDVQIQEMQSVLPTVSIPSSPVVTSLAP